MQRKPTLGPAFLRDLAEHNPLGVSLQPDDVQDWFDFIWLRYASHGYTRHRRAIVSWWSRVTEHEIEQARRRRDRIAQEAEDARLQELSDELNRPTGTEDAPGRFCVSEGGRGRG